MNNAVFGKTMENVIKLRDFKHVTTERRKTPNHNTAKFFTDRLFAVEMKKTYSFPKILCENEANIFTWK